MNETVLVIRYHKCIEEEYRKRLVMISVKMLADCYIQNISGSTMQSIGLSHSTSNIDTLYTNR